ncbi:50S ribosomal protein L25/general stress protein Ctc [Phenylobacterium sp.]|uniref:50S ribosomal protein L25/general stress protein Ctc n=1 Tax=Phenylobacterium sp. TaxID=1871053 RepID=UPI00286B4F74|nr:50S ribosomal protein L25/general stress protein Ctc [Phenylobacterium sp.]
MAEIVLNVEVRERTGTGGARVARRAGLVPGVLYGGDKDPVAISVKMNEFRKALYTGKLLGHLVTLKYGEETQPVIAKAVDMHPVTDTPWHFDLYRVDAHQQIKINVPLHFSHQDEAPGIKRGGTLNVVFHDVQVSCFADQIPEELVVDLTGLDIGASIRVSDLKLPANVTAAIPVETVVATISGASSQADADDAADAATSEVAATEAAAAAEEGGEA